MKDSSATLDSSKPLFKFNKNMKGNGSNKTLRRDSPSRTVVQFLKLFSLFVSPPFGRVLLAPRPLVLDHKRFPGQVGCEGKR